MTFAAQLLRIAARMGLTAEAAPVYAESRIERAVADTLAGHHQTYDSLDDELRPEALRRVQAARDGQ